MLQYLNELVVESKIIEDVPINVSLIEKNITAVVGNELLTKKFIDGLILQIITFHSYDDVRLVLLTDDMCKSEWSFMKKIPHIWNENKTMRFYGDNSDDVKQITNYLNEEFKFRCDKFDEDDKNNYLSFQPYYIIIVDSLKIVRTNDFIKKLLEQKQNLGFSILIKNDKLSNLPNECSTFINIDKQTSGIFENELVSDKQKEFNANIDEDIDLETCALFLSRIPIEFKNSKMMLPNSMGFLEMYNVGMIEQLNILNRWKKNDPTASLEAPVGVDENGQLFKLDLHEKASGPHGLIAGMTGSGKSEFIITYILSMAINYHPDEVQFVLIDYKGGGLAGAFENKDTGVKLPHLIGTITNLDNSEMNRSLASIQSELKRRQKIFNEARDRLNESTIDIYKYQKFYREGKVQNPVSHLFIISDEFAELKAQKPEFMDQLISTARIGRSLGVHLILATQKPSGVVDDQIWSNSKFRVCLKVQDKSDSMDMIKCPDAAGLKNVGRFYLDSLFPASDDLEFIFHLKKHAKTFNEKLFVFGVQLHFWQDHYLKTFHRIVFGDDHRGSYFDYAKYDKWCLYDCNSQKICTGSLNSNRLDFDFSHIDSVISKIYNWFYCLVARFLYPFLIKKYYSTGNFFKIDASCTDLLLQTYKSIAIEKGLNIMNINLTSELINKSIDTVVGAHAILSSLPFITLSDIEKLNAKKAYKQMQKNLIKKIKEYDWDLLNDDTLHRTDKLRPN